MVEATHADTAKLAHATGDAEAGGRGGGDAPSTGSSDDVKGSFCGNLALAAFCLQTASNAFMFMNYASVPEVAKAALHGIDDSELNMLYSAALLAVLPCTFPVAYYMVSQNYSVMLLGAVANAAGAWLRWASVHEGSYTLAVLGSVFIGIALSTVVTAVAYIPECWFPKHRQMMATSVGVQANYAGWALGAVLHPYVVGEPTKVAGGGSTPATLDTTSNERALEHLLFYQALVVSACFAVFLCVYRAPPMTPGRRRMLDGRVGFFIEIWGSFRAMFNTSFVLQALCTSALGGVSWVVPAVQAELFTTFSDIDSAWTNAAFMASGVIAGLILGGLTPKRIGLFLSTLYVIAATMLTTICFIKLYRSHLSFNTTYPVVLVLMAACGMAALGFIGPAIDSACAAAPSVPQSLSGGMIMWLLQVWGAILTPISVGDYGFVPCTVVAWGATVLYVVYVQMEARAARGKAMAADAATGGYGTLDAGV